MGERKALLPDLGQVSYRHARSEPQYAPFEAPIKARYPIQGFSFVRQVDEEDLLVEDFNAWADEQNPTIPTNFAGTTMPGASIGITATR